MGLKLLSALCLLSFSSFHFEAKRTPAELAEGYMFRDKITDDEMMLFIMPTKQICRVWMQNVQFDLDLAFLDDALNIIEIRPLYAYPEEKSPHFFMDKVTRSSQPVKYFMEAKAGFLEANELKVGDSIRRFVPASLLKELRIHR